MIGGPSQDGEPRFGSPPQTLAEWLVSFAEDCDNAARRSRWPLRRLRLREEARAFRVAADLANCAQQLRLEAKKVRP